MISSNVICQFGTGTLTIGCAKVPNVDDQWYIAIRPLVGEPRPVGTKVELFEMSDSYEIVLTFPSEKQMLTVHGSLVNQSYEEVKQRWDASAAEREASHWIARVAIS